VVHAPVRPSDHYGEHRVRDPRRGDCPLCPLVRAGLQHFLAMVYGNDVDTLRLLAQRVVPELRDLQVSPGA
jgi:hypothetical protein